MAYKSYSEKLKDPRWQRKRLEALELASWSCEFCGSETETLHVHHGNYEFGKEPWEYDLTSLHVLCESCHNRIGEKTKQIRRMIGKLPVYLLDQLCGYISGLAMAECPVCQTPVDSYEHAAGIGDAWRLSAEQVIALYECTGSVPVDGFALQEAFEVSRSQRA